jgi:hypothetical protein
LAATEAKLEATMQRFRPRRVCMKRWRTCGNHSAKNTIGSETVSVGISTSIGNDVTTPLLQTIKHNVIQSLQMEEHCSVKLKCTRNWRKHWRLPLCTVRTIRVRASRHFHHRHTSRKRRAGVVLVGIVRIGRAPHCSRNGGWERIPMVQRADTSKTPLILGRNRGSGGNDAEIQQMCRGDSTRRQGKHWKGNH